MKKIILGLYLFLLIYVMPSSVLALTDLTIMSISSNDWGDSTLLESNGKYLLIDVTSGESDAVLNFLESNNVYKFDMYLSHYHYDHYGGNNTKTTIDNETMTLMEYIIRTYEVGTLYLPDDTVISNEQELLNIKNRIVDAANEKNVQVVMLTQGSKFTLGNTAAEVLYMNKEDNANFLNNSSLVTMFTSGKTKFLTSGDIQNYTENKILAQGIDVSADIYKLSHHGLQHGISIANSANFINSVKPKYSYFQFNEPNVYNYGYNKVQKSIDNLLNFSNIYVTGINGNIKFVIEDDVITPIVEKNGRTITINYVDKDSKEILDTRTYAFNYKIGETDVKYYLHDYEKTFDGYTIDDSSDDIKTIGLLTEDITYNLYYTNNVTIENPKTGIDFGFGVMILLTLINGIAYILIRKKSKFLKHN